MDNSNTNSDTKETIKTLKHCMHCGEEISIGNTRFKTRKFCSVKCNRRYFSLQRYYKIKDSSEYKEYRKKYYAEWLDKNRDKFNASMRKASLKYQQKKKDERDKQKEQDKIQNKEVDNGVM